MTTQPSTNIAATTLADYRTQAGRFDELTDERGDVRELWGDLVGVYGRLGASEIHQRRSMADRLLVAEGASHVVHDDGRDLSMPWRLDPMPLLVSGREWATLEHGLVQRARLLDALLDDLYGEQTTLRTGLLPPALVYASGGYQRACLGIEPPAGRRLVVHGADVVRDATGRLVVLRDHTDAPSGAGYAQLNRIVLTRLFPDVYRDLRTQRLGDFFTGLRAALAGQAPGDRANPRTVVLSPGVGHRSYFEHSYLASHLGYNLVEGADLTVRDGRLWLRALSGLEPIDVVLRRVDDSAADPLELVPGGRGGVPGLVQVARELGVGLANAVGSGVAGSPAFLPFLPELCEHLLGEHLQLPSATTLWCGDPEHRSTVLARFDRMVLHDTDPSDPVPSAFGDRLDEIETAAWKARIEATPHRFVAQEKLLFATTPVVRDGAVVPGSVVIRTQVVATPAGYRALPGGLGRVVNDDVPVLRMATGTSKDIWVLAHGGDQQPRGWTRLDRADIPQIDLRESLPSRAAESLFWLGRNAERVESATRLGLAVITNFEQWPELAELAGAAWLTATVAGLRSVSGGDTTAVAPPELGQGAALLHGELALAAGGRSGAIGDSLGHLGSAAASVREFLSMSTWRVLALLDGARLSLPAETSKADLFVMSEAFDRILTAMSAFTGLVQDSIVRGPGWRFLDLGRRIERAVLLLNQVEAIVMTSPPPSIRQPLFETVLAANESLVAYRRRHRSDLELDAVCDLLLGDDTNPRSLAFQLDRIVDDLATLPERPERRHQEELARRAVTGLFAATWWPAADRGVPGAELAGLRQVVLDVRGQLFELSRSIVTSWFANVGQAHAVRRGPP